MTQEDSTIKTVQDQERLLIDRGFSKAPEGKTPLPGQYAILQEQRNDTTQASSPLFTFLINSGHSLQKRTGFTDLP